MSWLVSPIRGFSLGLSIMRSGWGTELGDSILWKHKSPFGNTGGTLFHRCGFLFEKATVPLIKGQ